MDAQINGYGQPARLGADGVVKFGSDDLMNVRFYNRKVPDIVESQRRGRLWEKSIPYVCIQHPGEKDNVDRPVLEDDVAKLRWPRQWAQFQNAQEQIPTGTPIDVLFPTSPEIPANLHSIAIHTVEQLAGLTAHGMQTIGMGATQWQAQAKQFLAAANGGAGMHRLNAENEKLKNALEVQGNQIALLTAQLNALVAEKEQKIPSPMVTQHRPTVAQAHAALMPAFKAEELSDEPLFIEAQDELDGPEITASAPEQPKRRGRPPRIQHQED